MKNLLIPVLVLGTMFTQAQIFSEDFNSGIPSTFTLTDLDGFTSASSVITGTGSFSAATIANQDCAGSVSWFNPVGIANDWMVTPAISIPNTSNSIGLQFDAICYESAYPDGVEIYVSTTGTSPSDFTGAPLYNSTPTTPGPISTPIAGNGENDTWTTRAVSLSNYVGQTIYIAFRNNSNDMHVLGIDNIIVDEVQDNNAKLESLNITPYSVAPANINIEGTVTNVGGNTITALDITWSDGTNSYTDNLTGLSIASYATYNFTHANQLSIPNPGSANISVTIDMVNNTVDPDMTNNTLSATATVVNAIAVRRPLVETFTSSTCGPCAPANVTAEALFAQNTGKFTSIKYQADFPGSGDPYFTQEGGNRRGYYSINSVPRMEIDGGWDQNGNNINQQVLDEYIDMICLMNMSATYSVDDKTVNIDIIIDPLESYPSNNLVVHAAIIEETTYNNVKTNGETQFEHVVKKMVPDDNGTAISSLTGGQQSTLNLTYTFNGNYRLPANATDPINHATEHSVEDFSNLMVVVWVQDVVTKEVHQSAYATSNTTSIQNDLEVENTNILVYPNPVKNTLSISGEFNNINIFDTFGKLVFSSDYSKNINVSSLSNGIYILNINTEKGIKNQKITITK